MSQRRKSLTEKLKLDKLKRFFSNDDLRKSPSPDNSDGESERNNFRKLDESFVQDVEKMDSIDEIITFLKDNEQSVGLTQHGIYELDVVDSRIQLFRLDPLKRKIFIH